MRKLNNLIKSGGGTGPMKPGNLTFYSKGANSCGYIREMRVIYTQTFLKEAFFLFVNFDIAVLKAAREV